MFSADFISGSREFTQDLTSGVLILIHSADACVFIAMACVDLRENCDKRSKKKVRGSGSKLMTQRLVNDYRLVVDRETIRELVKILDPEGVEPRGRRSLKRRQYRNKEPYYLWLTDGNHKLKPSLLLH